MTDETHALRDSGQAADQLDNSQSADGATASCAALTWIDIELVGEDGQPIPNVRFEVWKPDGTLLGRGRLDDAGCGGFEKIDDGTYQVCFPDLDEEAWEPA